MHKELNEISLLFCSGCLAACEEILDICSDDVIEDMDNQGRTALHLASVGGHGEVVDFLLSRGGKNKIFHNNNHHNHVSIYSWFIFSVNTTN